MLKYKYNEFPSDIFIMLEALEATLTIGKLLKELKIFITLLDRFHTLQNVFLTVDTNKREVTKSPQDFLSYNMKGKIIKHINIPARGANFKYESYKVIPLLLYYSTYSSF